MRTFAAIACGAMMAWAASTSSSTAAEPQPQKQAQAHQAEQQPAQTQTAAKDTNYRFFNGQWWYWMPNSKSWKVWDGRQWNDFQGSQTRTFSYEEPAATTFDSGVVETYPTYGRSYGYGYSNYPNNRIIGSFGFRGAGSKAEGRY